MGGIRCAKEIIDNMHGLVRVMYCMSASIFLNAIIGKEPSYESRDRFIAKSDELAKLCDDIVKEVETD